MYCIYLRKSRADREAEERGEGETLARHEKTLVELAKARKLPIGKIYKEVVSGDTIASRPQMQQLLLDLEQNMWEGVLVMEVERLARGDTMDQGYVSQAFRFSKTLIITPLKTYDPNNEFDEEYFEFGLYMSRREYNTIKRRLQAGRMVSIKEGKYVSSIAPYGYDRTKIPNSKGYMLKINKDEAKVVRLIFDFYVNGINGKPASTTLIAKELTKLGYKPRKSKEWNVSSIKGILTNVHYIGKIIWNRRKVEITMENGTKVKSRPRNYEYDTYDGIHEPIVDEEMFYKAQERIKDGTRQPYRNNMQNPLSGLIICSKCGHMMVRKPYNIQGVRDALLCTTINCNTASSPVEEVEKALLSSLQTLYNSYKIKITQSVPDISYRKDSLLNVQQEYNQTEKQLDKAYDMLEKEIYSIEEFAKRSEVLKIRLAELKQIIIDLEHEIKKENSKNSKEYTEQLKTVLEAYNKSDVLNKNALLKSILDKVEYSKEPSNRNVPDGFKLILHRNVW